MYVPIFQMIPVILSIHSLHTDKGPIPSIQPYSLNNKSWHKSLASESISLDWTLRSKVNDVFLYFLFFLFQLQVFDANKDGKLQLSEMSK